MNIKTTFLLFVLLTLISIGSYCQSVQTHPRLWIRSEDLPALKAKANSNNPYFNELEDFVNELKIEMDGGRIPSERNGYSEYSEYPSETTAMVFAFMSLITDGAESNDYATRAKTLVMYIMNRANQGLADGQPFRDERYSVVDRSRWFFFGTPLAVDWIYSRFTPAEKTIIRNVFLRWCDENTHANTTTDNHPQPVGTRLDPSLLEDTDDDARTRRRIRYASNNYYIAHLRNIYLMAASMDNSDDPGGDLHEYIDDVTGAWLYVTEEYLKNEGRGGLSAEGFLYGPSAFGRLAQTLLAIYTSGEANSLDPMRGIRSTFNMSFWDEILPANLNSITPISYTNHPWTGAGAYHLPFNYGDIQQFRIDDHMDLVGPLGWYDKMTGNNPTRLNMAKWYETHIPVGGAQDLLERVSHNGGAFEESIFYFLLFDPNDAQPTDPRSSISNTWYAQGIGRILARTDWTENASVFTFKCGFNSIDHQFADALSFSFYRKGAFLTSPLSGYGPEMSISKNQNSLALQNNNPGADPESPQGVIYADGSQWWSVGETDGKIVNWSNTDKYLTVTGDATGSYTYINPWVSPTGDNITHASRTAVWIKSGQIILYDRATSLTAGRYKQFWLGLPATPTILTKTAVVAAPNNQTLLVTNLLPANAVLTAQPYGEYPEPAGNDPMKARLMIEDPSDPSDVRFLHVLQGIDNGQDPLLSTNITSEDGSFQGCLVGDLIVLFKKNLGDVFHSFTFTAPANTNSFLITGLTPLANYTLAVEPQLDETLKVTVSQGAGVTADLGGVISQGDITPTGNVITKIEEGHEATISLSPNPTTGSLKIQTEKPIIEVKIIDMEGRLIKTINGSGTHEQLIDLASLSKGLFIVHVKTLTTIFSKKIIKQ